MDHQRCLRNASVHGFFLGMLAVASLTLVAPARADDGDNRDEGRRESRRDRDQSKTHIAVDFDYNAALEAPATNAGGGGALRLGQEFDAFLISLTPELGGSY